MGVRDFGETLVSVSGTWSAAISARTECPRSHQQLTAHRGTKRAEASPAAVIDFPMTHPAHR